MSTIQDYIKDLVASQQPLNKFSLPGENYTLCCSYFSDRSAMVECPFIPIAVFSIANAQFTTQLNGVDLFANDLRIVLELMPSVDIAVQHMASYNLSSFMLPAGIYFDSSKPDVVGERVVFLYLIEN